MKVVVVMPYYDRQEQLTRTLLSIKSEHKNFEVIVIDDNSPYLVVIPDVDYPVTMIRLTQKEWSNPDPVYNLGLHSALRKGADVIILQNPECIHKGDIIKYASEINDSQYFTFACYSVSKETMDKGVLVYNNRGANKDGDDAWYNHSVYRPVAYEFCAAITAKNIIHMNGYDERFMYGWGYADNYFLHRAKCLGLKVSIIDEPHVIHQWHYSGQDNPNKQELIKQNKELYEDLKRSNQFRALHIITTDL